VTDLLHEKINDAWIQKVSSYKKVRLFTNDILDYLEANGMTVHFNQPVHGMTTILATKA
jgi:hypothetical protein